MMHGYSDIVWGGYAVGFEGGVRMFIDFQAEPVKKSVNFLTTFTHRLWLPTMKILSTIDFPCAYARRKAPKTRGPGGLGFLFYQTSDIRCHLLLNFRCQMSFIAILRVVGAVLRATTSSNLQRVALRAISRPAVPCLWGRWCVDTTEAKNGATGHLNAKYAVCCF